jgi:hypothetical protein
VCLELRKKANEHPTFISRIITGDKVGVTCIAATTIAVEEPTTTKSKRGMAALEFSREHAHCFFDVKGIIHREFVPPNTMINSDFYKYCDF